MRNSIYKFILLFLMIPLFFACQREKLNELGIDFNEALIVPPQYDLPSPGEPQVVSKNIIEEIMDVKTSNDKNEVDSLVSQILIKTGAYNSSDTIRAAIDYDTGYKNDVGFFKWMISGASVKSKIKTSNQVVDPFEPNSD